MKNRKELEQVSLKEIATINSGQGAPQGEEWYTGKHIFVKAIDLNFLSNNKYVGDYCKRINNKAVTKYRLKKYPKNSIVFPKSGMSVKTDNVALLKYDSFVVNHLAIITLDQENENLAKYLYYYFKKIGITNLSRNSSYPSIRISELRNFKLSIPKRFRLEKIISTLEKADDLKFWRKEADILTNEYIEQIFLKMFGDPRNNHRKWMTDRLENVAKVERGKFSIRPRNDPSYYGGQYPFIQTGDISSSEGILKNYNQTLNEKGKRVSRSFPSGTIVIAIVGATIGETAILAKEMYAPDSVVGIIVNPKKANVFYIEFLLRFWKPIFKAIAPQTARANINLRIIRPLKIPLPPIELQNEFGELMNKYIEIKNIQHQSQDQINNLFDFLLKKRWMEI